MELENRKKSLTEAIEVEEAKRAIVKNDISILHFYEQFQDANAFDPPVRDYILDYFVDKFIFMMIKLS